MNYLPIKVEQRTSKNGKNYQVVSLEDANGQVTENVSTFDSLIEGRSVDGQIVQNGQYLNFKLGGGYGGKTAQMTQMMDKKQDAILFSQDRKADAIARAGSLKNATELVIAFKDEFGLGGAIEETVRAKIREYAKFYEDLYDLNNPLIPSNGQPF